MAITCNIHHKPGKAWIMQPDGEGGEFSLLDIRAYLDSLGLQNFSLEEFAEDQELIAGFYRLYF